jgi:serine/threonine-protein kinase
LSPDGKRVALDSRDEESDIWIWDFERQNLTRLTFDSGLDRAPIWTTDGRRIAFTSQVGAKLRLYWQVADGTGGPERLGDTEATATLQVKSISPDGQWLVVNFPGRSTRDIGRIDLMGDRRLKPLIESDFPKDNPSVSPDGRWIAHESNETGRDEIYVRPFPGIEGGRWRISPNGGDRAVWSRDGSELFYIEPPGRMMAVSIKGGAAFSPGRPQLLFEGNYAGIGGRTYDVAADGRFLFLKTMGESESTPPGVIVVLDWLEDLKRLVPTN